MEDTLGEDLPARPDFGPRGRSGPDSARGLRSGNGHPDDSPSRRGDFSALDSPDGGAHHRCSRRESDLCRRGQPDCCSGSQHACLSLGEPDRGYGDYPRGIDPCYL
jgi:hypothetical protein